MAGFQQALDFVLDREGGVSDHPADTGGLTKWGVTQLIYDRWRKKHDLPTRPVTEMNEPEMEACYHEFFWVEAHGDGWWWPLSLAVFDAAVQHSPPRAIKLLQAASGAKVDGVVGPQTRRMVRQTPRMKMLARMRWERLDYYARIVRRMPSQAVFIVGWVNRIRLLDERMSRDVGLAA